MGEREKVQRAREVGRERGAESRPDEADEADAADEADEADRVGVGSET